MIATAQYIYDVMEVVIIGVSGCPQEIVQKPLKVIKILDLTCVALTSLLGAHIEYAN